MFSINILGTGSGGNCAVISDGDTGIMIDAGMKSGIDFIGGISAVLITHSHL